MQRDLIFATFCELNFEWSACGNTEVFYFHFVTSNRMMTPFALTFTLNSWQEVGAFIPRDVSVLEICFKISQTPA